MQLDYSSYQKIILVSCSTKALPRNPNSLFSSVIVTAKLLL